MLKPPFDRRSMVEVARQQLLRILEEQSQQEGTKLPSERVLASQLGVSRPTLREALRLLEEEGRIVRHPGLGTFITEEPVVETGLEQLASFTEMMQRAGYQAGTSMSSIEQCEMSDEEAEALAAEPGSPKYIVRRVRTLNGIPAAYMEHVVSVSVVGSLTKPEVEGSIFEAIERKTRMNLAYSKTEVYPAHAGKEIGSYLGLAENAVLLVLEEVIYNAAKAPVLLALTYFRPDLHRYHMVRWRPDS